jgi:ribonuclease VapC
MIVDASAVLAILFAEPDADRYAAAITHVQPRAMSAVNWFEAAIAIDRRGPDGAAEKFDQLLRRGRIEVVAYTPQHAVLARQAYHAWGKGRHRA